MVRTALGQSIPRQCELTRSSSGEGVAKLRLPICITCILLFLLNFSPPLLRLVTGPLLTACVVPCCVEASDLRISGTLELSLEPKGPLSSNTSCEQIGLVCHQLVCTHVALSALYLVLMIVIVPLAAVTDLKSSWLC